MTVTRKNGKLLVMEQTAILELKNNKDFYIGKDVLVGGWVKNFRESKATSFWKSATVVRSNPCKL